MLLAGGLLAAPSAHADFEDIPPELWGQPVAAIKLEGLSRTREYIVTRELLTSIGQPLLQDNLTEELQAFEQMDIFAEARVSAASGLDGIAVTYHFIELFKILPSIALKISDESGVSAGGGIKMPNFTGRGILLSARVLFGGLTELEFWLDDPWVTGNHFGYRVEYYHREKINETVNFNEKADELYLWAGPHLGKNGRIGLHASYIQMISDAANITLSDDRKDHTARLGMFLGYDSLDSYMNTTDGWWGEVVYSDELGFMKKAGGTYNQIDLDLRRYVHMGGRHTLAGFALTTIRGGDVGHQVAPWEMFAIGGTNTVRGWPFAARRGKNQMINTLEYRFTLLKPKFWDLPLGFRYRGGLQLALFGDYGVGWEESDQFAASNFIGGFGVGVRLLIPIVGMARLDVGFGERGLTKMYFHLGSFEKATMARRRVR